MNRANSIIKFLLPKEERFHQLLARDTKNLLEAARLFSEIAKTADFDERREKVAQLKAIEHQGDLITREVFLSLNVSFITPFDRDDIQSIAMDLDDILDYLEGAAQCLVLFELEDAPDPLRQFSQILVNMVEKIDLATGMIWNLSNEKKVNDIIVQVSELENQADQLYNTVIADLFGSKERHPLEIMKWKEVYQGLEEACDACRNYTNIIANVVVKNA